MDVDPPSGDAKASDDSKKDEEKKAEEEGKKDEDTKKAEKEVEPEFEMLKNPTRALRGQLKLISLDSKSRYRPVKPVSCVCVYVVCVVEQELLVSSMNLSRSVSKCWLERRKMGLIWLFCTSVALQNRTLCMQYVSEPCQRSEMVQNPPLLHQAAWCFACVAVVLRWYYSLERCRGGYRGGRGCACAR